MDAREIRDRLLAVEQALEEALKFETMNWWSVSRVEWALGEMKDLLRECQ